MDGGIEADIPLDYIEFHVFPSQKRYEASICRGNNCEVAASGSLEPLLFHCPQIKALNSEGSDGNKIKLIASDEDVNNGSRWFTKSTLLRFLEIISSSDVLDATVGLRNEISQLEEARSFHLSLYGKDTTDSVSSDDNSKNELLRAMYLRLSALRAELSNALVKAPSMTLSRGEITDLEKFSSLIEATDLRKSFCNLVEELGLENGTETKSVGISENGGESSDDSVMEDEPPSVERSRTLIRSASPRRSASPMRRVQIGRSGSRRSTPLTIKSLNYFHRDKLVEQSDGEDDETEQQHLKKSVSSSNNARRISVQDAISLFESKQKDQTKGGMIQKINSFSGPNKSVLRRWSAGPGTDKSVELAPPPPPLPETESKPEEKTSLSEDGHEVDFKPERCEEIDNDTAPLPNERQTASAEWSRQKEAELDQLLMKMMETKSSSSSVNNNSKIPNISGGKKGEMGRENGGGKQAERAKQQESIAKRIHGGGGGNNKHYAVNSQKSKKTSSSPVLLPDAVKESSKKSSVFRKALPKKTSPSSLPATRKSWPSGPSPRTTTTVISTAKSKTLPETASIGTTTMRRKSQPLSATKMAVVSPQQKPKPPVKATPSEDNKGSKVVNSVNKTKQQQQPVEKNPKLTKVKTRNAGSTEKPSLYSKVVTKKSSVVVPLEPKPFLRKGSKGGVISPISKSKVSSQPDEIEPPTKDDSKDQMLLERSETVIVQQEVDLEPLKDHIQLVSEPETEIKSPEKSLDFEKTPIHQLAADLPENGSFRKNPQFFSNNQVIIDDELTISPSAWVVDRDEEEEQHEEDHHALGDDEDDDDVICPIESSSSPTKIAESGNGMPNSSSSPPRVRHSLSQMLLEEIGETEWGNAENPPTSTMAFQKDAPRGLKKLLKFARKSNKTDGNSTGFSVFSEGEDDADESKSLSKSSENLLKMATLHGKARSNINKSSSHSLSGKGQDGRSNFSSIPTTKAPRSFFSLSAFGSGK